MLYEPARHDALLPLRWDESAVRHTIECIVADTEARFSEERYWPLHPLDAHGAHDPRRFETSLYDGACGVIWALRYLESVGACALSRRYGDLLERLAVDNLRALGGRLEERLASFLLGDTPIRMMAFADAPTSERASLLADLVTRNVDHPARELILGSPGTLLAALFLHEQTQDERWSDLFRLTVNKLWQLLEWSPQHRCAYWTQRLFGRSSNYLDAVHGFVATALPLIRGRHLLGDDAWRSWERTIVDTVERTADRRGAHANWRPELDDVRPDQKKLVQFCHGAPGFVVCLAGLPSTELDDLLAAAGELVWSAGPLAKGSNLCHGTGGNGYAFLKLYGRTGDSRWLARARSFAMHGIAQTSDAAARCGQSRYSLWTGDLGFAIICGIGCGRKRSFRRSMSSTARAAAGSARPTLWTTRARRNKLSIATRTVATEAQMDQETFNLSIRKFLKMVGVNSQREIEQAVDKAMAARTIAGTESFPARVTLEVAGLAINVRFDGVIKLQ